MILVPSARFNDSMFIVELHPVDMGIYLFRVLVIVLHPNFRRAPGGSRAGVISFLQI